MIIWKGDRWGLKEGWGEVANPYGSAVLELATSGSYTDMDGTKKVP